ncbi:MAG: Ribosomal silencing factor RsfA [Firmicutes bacterium]|nr:Ribosomal silencing factor RsfA [Bacillota bacterium]MDI6705769.1 ribosome silencing factor [Bacillota bacterium]
MTSPKEMARVAVEAAKVKKAFDIVVLDIRTISILADYFVICSGRSTTQVKAIADEIDKQMQMAGFILDHVEGYKEEKWILLDYKDIVVHVFYTQEREFYNLERLWGDAAVMVRE